MTRRQSFLPWLQRGAFDIVQPDVTKVRRHFGRAQNCLDGRREWHPIHSARLEYRIGIGSRPSARIRQQAHGYGRISDRSPFIDEIVETKWKLDEGGMLPVPERPGLGVSLDLDVVEKYTGKRFQLP